MRWTLILMASLALAGCGNSSNRTQQGAASTSAQTQPSPEMVEIIWKSCAACHTLTHDPKGGPGLAGIMNRVAGTEPEFHYQFTQYIKGKPWVWDEAHLRKWMCDSQQAVREFTGDPHAETTMPSMHICSPEGQAAVLSKLKSASSPIPADSDG